MNKLKDMWQNNKKKVIIYGGIGLFIFILIIVLILFFVKFFKRYDYVSVEKMMVVSTEKYLKAHPEMRPNEELSTVSIPASTLINEKYLKNFSKLTKDVGCFGEVHVSFLQGMFRYEPTLTCANYETKTLYQAILEFEDIKLQDDGLYDINDFYTYRGEYVANYISFAGFSWRILKFNEEMIYLILEDTVNNRGTTYVFDDRYNETTQSNRGKNNFESSRIAHSLQNIYTNDFPKYHQYMLQMAACTHPRSKNDRDLSGAIECHTTFDTFMALPSVYDYMNASLDFRCTTSDSMNCSNYNYLAKTTNNWWFLNGTNENSYQVYYSNQVGKLGLDSASSKKDIRPVIAIPSTLNYKSGVGTKEKPYSFVEY